MSAIGSTTPAFECSICFGTVAPNQEQVAVHTDQGEITHRFCLSDLFGTLAMGRDKCSLCNRSIFPLEMSNALSIGYLGPRLINSLPDLKSLAVYWSLNNDHPNILQRFITQEMDQLTQERVLICAVQRGYKEIVKNLVNLRPIPNDTRSAALSAAVNRDDCDIAAILIKDVPRGVLNRGECESALVCMAKKEGNLETIQKIISLLDNEITIHSRGLSVICAIQNGHFDYVPILANGPIHSKFFKDCLIKAIEKNSLETFNHLLIGRQINASDEAAIMSIADFFGNQDFINALKEKFNRR